MRSILQKLQIGDSGDTYNYSPPRKDLVVDQPISVAVRVLERGPLRARIAIDRTYHWPERVFFGERSGERREILTLAIATCHPYQGAGHTSDGGECRADIGTLGIVNPAHTITIAHFLHAMLKTAECLQSLGHCRIGQADYRTQGQCGQCIGLIVAPHQGQFTHRQQDGGSPTEAALPIDHPNSQVPFPGL